MNISYSWKDGNEVLEQYLSEYAVFMAQVFAEPPWTFHWQQYVNEPEHPDSPHVFLRNIAGHGGNFIEVRNEDRELLGYAILIESLTEEALNGDYLDLLTFGDASEGDAYFAGLMVRKDMRCHGIGERLTEMRIEKVKPSKRCLLRTQRAAAGVMRIAANLGFTVYREFELRQAGVSLERVLLVREAGR